MSTLRRLPLTLAFAAAVVGVALVTSGPGLTARPDVVARFGWAPHDLWDGTWWSLATAVFLLHRPFLFPVTVALLFGTTGVLEWQAGTRRALAVYALGDVLATLALAAGTLALFIGGSATAAALVAADDVGVSGGAFACLGAWTGRLAPRWGRLATIAVVIVLVAGLWQPDGLEADLLHAVAFPVGRLLDRALTRRAVSHGVAPRGDVR